MFRNRMPSWSLAALVFFSYLVALPHPGAGCEFKIGYEDEAPYHFLDKWGLVIGTDAELLREALIGQDCRPAFMVAPWKRTLNGVRDGELDIAMGAKFLDERARFAHYSVPYKSIRHHLFTREGEYAGVDSLESFLRAAKGKLGVVLGWGYPPEIARLINDKKYSHLIEKAPQFKLLPRMLDHGRLEGIIANLGTLREQVAREPFTHQFAPRAEYEEPLHFLFSKKTMRPEVVKKINNSIRTIINSGRRDQIFSKYTKN